LSPAAPALQSLIARTERLEMLAASLPAVVVDATGRSLGPALGLDHYSERYTFASTQTRGTTLQIGLDGLPPFLAEVRRDTRFAPHHTGLRLNSAAEVRSSMGARAPLTRENPAGRLPAPGGLPPHLGDPLPA